MLSFLKDEELIGVPLWWDIVFNFKEFENDLVKEEAKFSDIKEQFEDAKETSLLREEDKARVQRRIAALDDKWAELNKLHDENRRR